MAKSNAAVDMLHKVEYKSGVGANRIDTYSTVDIDRYMEEFEMLKAEGKILSEYKDNAWRCYSDVVYSTVAFNIDDTCYRTHFGKQFDVPLKEAGKALKLYAIYISRKYIFTAISYKIAEIIKFMTRYGNEDYLVDEGYVYTIKDFLRFFEIPKAAIARVERSIMTRKSTKLGPRKLASLVTYLAIDNEIKDIYNDPNISDEEFVQWFPIFFWSQVTFILPMRPTEILVTPLDCLQFVKKRNGTIEVWIHILRTTLKKRKRVVHHDIDGDYDEFAYKVYEYKDEPPLVVSTIMKYKKLTKAHERTRLFDSTSDHKVNVVYSLERFNYLLNVFVTRRLFCNSKYSFAKFAANIEEFEIPTMGDSRHIAMANLRFQNISSETCRQLAEHEDIRTSYGYYENVGNTIQAASIMEIQRRLTEGELNLEAFEKDLRNRIRPDVHRSCMSPRNPMETGDVADCIKQNCQEIGCVGCSYYVPTEKDIDRDVAAYKEKLDEAVKKLFKGIEFEKNGKEVDMDALALDAQTRSARYKVISDLKAIGECKKWARYKIHRRSTDGSGHPVLRYLQGKNQGD